MAHRGLMTLVFVAITAFFAAGLRNVELKTIFSDLLPKDDPFVQVFKDHPNFGNPLTITLMVKNKDGDIYNAETLAKVWKLTRDIDLAPGVDHDQILSIATEKARYAEATPEGIDMRPLMEDHVPATPEEIAAIVAVFASLGGTPPAPKRARSLWATPQPRRTYAHGLGGWRASGLPH